MQKLEWFGNRFFLSFKLFEIYIGILSIINFELIQIQYFLPIGMH